MTASTSSTRRSVCRYSVGDLQFVEQIRFDSALDRSDPAVLAAARLIFLLAGVSYYKTSAPPVIDLGDHALTPAEREFLRDYYPQGLGEFAYRNDLELDIEIRAREAAPNPADYQPKPGRPLVPFGGGIDSIVSVEQVRSRCDDVALFVSSPGGALFDAIEAPAALQRPSGGPGDAHHRRESAALTRVRLSERPRAGDGHPVGGGRAGRGEHRSGCRRDVQREVGLGADPGARRSQHQPPVLQELVVRAGVPGRARRGARAAAGLLLAAASLLRTVGRRALRQAARLPPRLPQLQPRVPHRSGCAPRPLVRPLRQVLLHRPRARAVPHPRTSSAPSSAGSNRCATRRWPTSSGRCSACCRIANPSNASAISTNAGPRWCSPLAAATALTVLGRSGATAGRAAPRATTSPAPTSPANS